MVGVIRGGGGEGGGVERPHPQLAVGCAREQPRAAAGERERPDFGAVFVYLCVFVCVFFGRGGVR